MEKLILFVKNDCNKIGKNKKKIGKKKKLARLGKGRTEENVLGERP